MSHDMTYGTPLLKVSNIKEKSTDIRKEKGL